MSNPFATPQTEGNPFASGGHSVQASQEEIDVIRRTNTKDEPTSVSFGLVEIPREEMSEFDKPLGGGLDFAKGFASRALSLPRTAGGLIAAEGELGQAADEEGLTAFDKIKASFYRRAAENIMEGDTGIKGFLQTIWGTQKDALLAVAPDIGAHKVIAKMGYKMVEQNDAALRALNLIPKNGGSVAYDLGGATASIGFSVGSLVLTKSPAIAFVYAGAVAGSEDYLEARKTKDPEDAFAIAAGSAYGQGLVEILGGKYFLAAAASSSFLKKVIKRTIGQGLEEGAQTGVEEAALSDVRDKNMSQIMQSVGYAALIGIAAGAPVSTVATAAERRAVKLGASKEQAKIMSDNVIKNKDVMADAVAEMYQKEMSGVLNNAQQVADSAAAVKRAIQIQEDIIKAKETGSTEDPQVAARILLETADERTRAAILALPENFTIDQLQQAKIESDAMTVEASSVESLKKRNKLVDSQGNELVMHRGSRTGSFVFDKSAPQSTDAGNMGSGLYASPSTTIARASGDDVRQIDMRLENPLEIIRDNNYKENVQKAADSLGVVDKPQWSGSKQTSKKFADEFTQKALSAGHDGAIARMPNGDIIEAVQYAGTPKLEAIGGGTPPSQPPGTPPTGGTGDGSKRAFYQSFLNKRPKQKESEVEMVASAVGKALSPISTRSRNINPKLEAVLRKYERAVNVRINQDQKAVLPFLQGYSKLSKQDKIIVDAAMKNGDIEIIDEIMGDTSEVRKTLDGLYERAKSVGLNIGYLEGYFPRIVTKPKLLLEYFEKTEAWNDIQQAIKNKEAELGTLLTNDEKAQLINTLLRGYETSQITLARPGSLKERNIDVVTPEIVDFYDSSDQALLKYITSVNEAVEARKFFGKGENMADSIGAFVLRELEAGTLNPNQAQELSEILKARFTDKKMNPILKAYKNFSYIDTMGSSISAITQIGDIGYAMSNSGFFNTLSVLPKSITNRTELTLEDIGVEAIAQEFQDSGKMGNAVRTVFKLTGLKKMDSIGKLTVIQAALNAHRKAAVKPTAKYRKSLEYIFGEETDQVLSDLKNKVNSENVKMLLFNDLLNLQPIALSEMPEMYLSHPNGRIFYMLKTFTIKQYDIYRRQVFQEIRDGNTLTGLKNLIRLVAFFTLMNAGADFLKDLVLDRETPPEDHVVNNIARLFGFGKYQIYSVRREGLGTAAFKTVAPPFKAIDAVSKDLTRKTDRDIDDLDIISSIPLAGKMYYWWFGGGAERDKEKKQNAGIGKI